MWKPSSSCSPNTYTKDLITDDDRDSAQAVLPETQVELGEVQALGSHAYSTRNRCSRDYPARPRNPRALLVTAATIMESEEGARLL